jgi:hypothetical protein
MGRVVRQYAPRASAPWAGDRDPDYGAPVMMPLSAATAVVIEKYHLQKWFSNLLVKGILMLALFFLVHA